MFLSKCLLTGVHKTGATLKSDCQSYLHSSRKSTVWPESLVSHKVVLHKSQIILSLESTSNSWDCIKQAKVKVSFPP